MEVKANVGFSLKGIVTEQFAIIEESFKEEADINLRTDIGFGIDQEKKVARVQLKINYLCSEQPFMVLEVTTYFNISPESFDTFLNEDKTILTIPAGFARHLGVITVGTARGILHDKTENTEFNKFFLPTINLVDLVKEDVVFNF
jgi:hypothetical protein